FILRHADNDLDHLLEETVPPLALDRLGIFRAVMAKHRKKAAEEEKTLADERTAELLETANLKHAEQQLTSDLEAVQTWLDQRDEHAERQGGLDMQFLAARYSKGKKAVSEFADSRNRAVVFDTGCIEAHTDLLAYQAKACGKKTDPHLGQVERYTILILDATVWPNVRLILNSLMLALTGERQHAC
ncbi:unnamed protein product, partial [Symbiodinium microadriaticum]